MSKEMKYFCCYHSYEDLISEMDYKQIANLFTAAFEYSIRGNESELETPLERTTFKVIKRDIDVAKERYQDMCDGNRKKANKRWHGDECNGIQQYADEYHSMPTHANDAKVKEKVIVKVKENERVNIYGSEPQADTEPNEAENAVISIPLNDGTEYGITQNDVDEWTSLYPAVDIMQELREIRGWNLSNPNKRKTARGIKKHINNWLAREQDKGGSKAATSTIRKYENLL